MLYILVVIGLIMIYIGLKFEKKTNSKETISSFIPGNADIEKLKELEQSIKYLSARIDDIEGALLILDDKMYKVNSISEDTTSKKDSLKQENNNEIKNMENKFEEILEENYKKKDINKSIYKLYDSGKSIEEIASELRIGKGEVSLRLGLRK